MRVGLVAAIVTFFLAAPWLAMLATLTGAHMLRTWSWTAQARREKVWRRGRRRWYDPVAAVAAAPWFALVALGGTSLLALWVGVALAGVAAVAMIGGLPASGALAVGGLVLALTSGWGPGARRVRVPLDRAMRRASRSTAVSIAAVAMLAVAVAVLAFSASAGPSWEPFGSPLAWLR